MTPDARKYFIRDQYYVRELLFMARATLSAPRWADLAVRIGVAEMTLNRIVNLNKAKLDYPLQFLIESMLPEQEVERIRRRNPIPAGNKSSAVGYH